MSLAPVEIDGQYRALRESAGAFERPDRRSLQLAGPEAVEYVQGQVTNEVEALEPGQGCYAALLDRKGHLQADLRVLRTDDGLRLDMEAVGGDAAFRHLSTYKVGREVTVVEVTDRLTVISVIGPAAAGLMLGGPAGPEHAHRETKVGGVACLAVSTDLGVDLLASRTDMQDILAALVSAGAEPVSEAAAEIVRVEAGRPRFGREMTTATIPQEAGINDRAVSFTKGCYIGQETVARLHYRGKPNRHLRGLRLAEPAADGDPVRLGERELGTIGTAVISPARGPIALAILRREAEPGIAVEVGEGVSAEVLELPF